MLFAMHCFATCVGHGIFALKDMDIIYRFARSRSVEERASNISSCSSVCQSGLSRYCLTVRSFTSARRRLLKSSNLLKVNFAICVQSSGAGDFLSFRSNLLISASMKVQSFNKSSVSSDGHKTIFL